MKFSENPTEGDTPVAPPSRSAGRHGGARPGDRHRVCCEIFGGGESGAFLVTLYEGRGRTAKVRSASPAAARLASLYAGRHDRDPQHDRLRVGPPQRAMAGRRRRGRPTQGPSPTPSSSDRRGPRRRRDRRNPQQRPTNPSGCPRTSRRRPRRRPSPTERSDGASRGPRRRARWRPSSSSSGTDPPHLVRHVFRASSVSNLPFLAFCKTL